MYFVIISQLLSLLSLLFLFLSLDSVAGSFSESCSLTNKCVDPIIMNSYIARKDRYIIFSPSRIFIFYFISSFLYSSFFFLGIELKLFFIIAMKYSFFSFSLSFSFLFFFFFIFSYITQSLTKPNTVFLSQNIVCSGGKTGCPTLYWFT